MKRSCRNAPGCQPHPPRTDLEKVLGEYVDLYQQEVPSHPGRPVPTHVIPFDIDDEKTTEGEIEAAVRRLRRNRAGGHTYLRGEHLHARLGRHIERILLTTPPNQPNGLNQYK